MESISEGIKTKIKLSSYKQFIYIQWMEENTDVKKKPICALLIVIYHLFTAAC
jgi:hypothetical protein